MFLFSKVDNNNVIMLINNLMLKIKKNTTFYMVSVLEFFKRTENLIIFKIVPY